MLSPPKKTLQKCKDCKVCNPAKAYSIAPFHTQAIVPFRSVTTLATHHPTHRSGIVYFFSGSVYPIGIVNNNYQFK
jgi:hypothetical protein